MVRSCQSLCGKFRGILLLRLAIAQFALIFILGACAAEGNRVPPGPTWMPVDGQPLHWKALLVGGDNKEAAFDNAAFALARMLRTAGMAEDDIEVVSAFGAGGAKTPDLSNLRAEGARLNVQPGDGCLIFMTAHGSSAGLALRGFGGYQNFSPAQFDDLLARSCRQAPTLVVTSACYSGVFAVPPMRTPNRVIYTAARRDRPSNGCDASLDFTFFDHCFLSSLPDLGDWPQLADRAAAASRSGKKRSMRPPPSRNSGSGRT
jgi:hypothetical protein